MEMKITRLCEMLTEDAGMIVEPHHLPEYRLAAAAQVFLDRSGPTGPTATPDQGLQGCQGCQKCQARTRRMRCACGCGL
ncbi:hypothetical protein E4U43_008585 [Claviceps pusilla]|uniref:Uncharacterized protein n=1 Tax=Claviceps pusilla TaxID=123648 RepID=A0A9P7NB45_9HYPO|nr:hypothetical protein E4U43_008585 [Claviceps pusilla]